MEYSQCNCLKKEDFTISLIAWRFLIEQVVNVFQQYGEENKAE